MLLPVTKNPESYRTIQMNEEQKELYTGRTKQKNVKILAESENFQGGHKKGCTR